MLVMPPVQPNVTLSESESFSALMLYVSVCMLDSKFCSEVHRCLEMLHIQVRMYRENEEAYNLMQTILSGALVCRSLCVLRLTFLVLLVL